MTDGARDKPAEQPSRRSLDETAEYRADQGPADRPAESDSALGTELGEYVLLEEIGAGGGGRVYKAEHRRMERIVALKVLPKSTPLALKRFHQEVKAAAKLIHPNIVTAFDAGEHDGMPYLVMEFVDGRSLARVVEEDGPVHINTACDFILQAARGLAYAHSRQIVHRDIKPSNLMLDRDGVIKILDMGLARYGAASADSSAGAGAGLTEMGTVVGTVHYMSPEQTRDSHMVDHRSDIYSLGCTFYYLLTAQPVYSGDMIGVLLAHCQEPIPSLRAFREDVPEALDAVYQRMLAKRPEERYQAITEVVVHLERFISHTSGRAAAPTPPRQAERAGEAARTMTRLPPPRPKPAAVIPQGPAVGIDVGCTQSAIAQVDKKTGRPWTLVNAQHEPATPSVVLLDGSRVAVGTAAMDAVGLTSDSVALHIKRDLGRNLFHRPLSGREYPPEVLLALILNKLAEDGRRDIGDFKQVVLAVPSSFDDARRKAVEDAAYIAGLELLDLINAPMAVAVAYAHERQLLTAKAPPQTLCVCDLGGGALDVAVIRVHDAQLTALANGGGLKQGGCDWDNQLTVRAAKVIQDKYGLDPRENPNLAGKLWRACEQARRTLSTQEQALIEFEFEGTRPRIPINRRQLESYTRDLVEDISTTIRSTVQRAGVEWSNLDQVLLVGGLAQTPLLHDTLQQLAQRPPDTSLASGQAVAHGAALYASTRLAQREGRTPPWEIVEVNAHGLGIVGVDTRTGEKLNVTLIPRDSRLPTSHSRTFKIKAGQDTLSIQIVQGESASLRDCSWIGKCVIEDLPPELPAGTPLTVEFRCAGNGRLTVLLEHPLTRQKLPQEIRRATRLGRAELEHWRGWVETTALCAGLGTEG